MNINHYSSKPTLRSHTHLQAAQADTHAKACKRVCLPNRTRTVQTLHDNTSTERRAACNTGLAKVAVQFSADTFVVNQSLALRINICGENRHLTSPKQLLRIENMINTVHYKKGTENNIAFVFSCPGKLERDSNPSGPAKGETGNNLEYLINFLSNQTKTKGISSDKVTITNSWSKVEFISEGGTGRSEATIKEILKCDNLIRLTNELSEIERYIFVCGINAKTTLKKIIDEKKLNKAVKVFDLRHLGNQSLNQISFDKDGESIISYSKTFQKPITEKRSLKAIRKDNKIRRLEKVAFDLYQNIENENSL